MENKVAKSEFLKMEPLYNQQFQFKYSKELKVGTTRHICTPMFIAVIFIIIKMWKQTKYR